MVARSTTHYSSPITMSVDSEHYRQQLVKDGDRRFQEWHSALLAHQAKFRQPVAATTAAVPKPAVDSETYRQNLVKDGDRRYHEWHSAFLDYQKRYLDAMRRSR